MCQGFSPPSPHVGTASTPFSFSRRFRSSYAADVLPLFHLGKGVSSNEHLYTMPACSHPPVCIAGTAARMHEARNCVCVCACHSRGKLSIVNFHGATQKWSCARFVPFPFLPPQRFLPPSSSCLLTCSGLLPLGSTSSRGGQLRGCLLFLSVPSSPMLFDCEGRRRASASAQETLLPVDPYCSMCNFSTLQ